MPRLAWAGCGRKGSSDAAQVLRLAAAARQRQLARRRGPHPIRARGAQVPQNPHPHAPGALPRSLLLRALSSQSGSGAAEACASLARASLGEKHAALQAASLGEKRILVAIDEWDTSSAYPTGHYVRTLGNIGDRECETEARRASTAKLIALSVTCTPAAGAAEPMHSPWGAWQPHSWSSQH